MIEIVIFCLCILKNILIKNYNQPTRCLHLTKRAQSSENQVHTKNMVHAVKININVSQIIPYKKIDKFQ
jgi:hypothetical protein